jgi:hypothetical protein
MALLFALFFFELYLTTAVDPGQRAAYQQLLDSRIVSVHEYRTKWTSSEKYEPMIAARYKPETAAVKFTVVSGQGNVTLESWDEHGIRLAADITSSHAMIRLYHRYFPLWQLHADPSGATLQPEEGTGLMLLTLPQGKSHIVLSLESRLDSLLGAGAKR